MCGGWIPIYTEDTQAVHQVRRWLVCLPAGWQPSGEDLFRYGCECRRTHVRRKSEKRFWAGWPGSWQFASTSPIVLGRSDGL